MGDGQFVSRCWGVDPDFALSFTDDERRKIEEIAGAGLASQVFEELRALAFHAQSRRSLTAKNEDIVRARLKCESVAGAARRLLDELADVDGGFGDAAPSLFGFGREVVADDVAGEVAIYDEVRAKREFGALVATIERIEQLSIGHSVSYGLSESGSNASDRLKEYVVDGVIDLYRNLLVREIPPSGGNPSGPAARFLLAAANAILRMTGRGLFTPSAARQQLARRRSVHL